MSLVEVQPSTSRVLNEWATPWVSAALSCGRGGRRVGGEHRQHRGHVGRQHGRPLRHATDAEPVALDHDLLGVGVGGHDGGGRGLSPVDGPGGDEGGDGGVDRLDRHRDADEPGRAHQHLVAVDAELGRDPGAHLDGVAHAGLAGGGVGVAAVEDHGDGLARTGLQVFPGDPDRRRGHEVAGEHAGGGDGPAVGGGDQGQVGGAGVLDAGRDAGGDETPGGGHTHG